MFANFSHLLSVLLQGALPTVELTVGGIVFATLTAFAAGFAGMARSRVVRVVVRLYVEIWRGTSEVVQLFWIYFAVPLLLGLQIVPVWSGVLVLGLNGGAYGAEIVRGAVRAVPAAQHEGAIALSLTAWQRTRLVILPQAVVEMIPPLNTLYIQLLKATSLASLINVSEIAYQGKQILEPTYSSQMPLILTMMLVMYLILSVVITAVMRVLERVLSARVGRRPLATRTAGTVTTGVTG